MKLCSACSQEQPKENFSKKQWHQLKQQRRCRECVDANLDVLRAPPENVSSTPDNAAGGTTPSSRRRQRDILPHKNITSSDNVDYEAPSSRRRQRDRLSRPPPKNTTSTDNVDDEAPPSCWICLDEGIDEAGQSLVRDCSCRGHSGYAHISCTVKYAEQKNRDVKIRNSAVHVVMENFVGPWKVCPNCHQLYQNELAADLANAFVAFVETNYPLKHGKLFNQWLHVEAHLVKLNQHSQSIKNEEIIQVANSIVNVVGEIKAQNFPLPPPLQRVLQIEAAAYDRLGCLAAIAGTKESLQSAVEHYEKCRDTSKAMGNTTAVTLAEQKIANAKSNLCWGGIDKISRGEIQKHNQYMYEEVVRNLGESSGDALNAGVNLARALKHARRGVEAQRLLKKILATSSRVHGPDHNLTKAIESTLSLAKIRNVAIESRGVLATLMWMCGFETNQFFQFLRYDDGDGDMCVLRGPVQSLNDAGKGKIVTIAAEYLIFVAGTPVMCHGMEDSDDLLEGKIGDIRTWNPKLNRHEVHFEDESLEPCFVSSRNIRILVELPDDD